MAGRTRECFRDQIRRACSLLSIRKATGGARPNLISLFVLSDLFLELSAREFPVCVVERNPFCLAVALEDGIVFFGC